jgi:hypothetical protein
LNHTNEYGRGSARVKKNQGEERQYIEKKELKSPQAGRET